MSDTLLNTLAANAKTAIEAAALTVDGQALKVYDYQPASSDSVPSVYIEGPETIEWVHDDDGRNSEIGSFDWSITFKLVIRTRMDSAEQGQKDARSLLGGVFEAINKDDPTLGGSSILGAFITNVEIDLDEVVAQTRVARYTADLVCKALTPTT